MDFEWSKVFVECFWPFENRSQAYDYSLKNLIYISWFLYFYAYFGSNLFSIHVNLCMHRYVIGSNIHILICWNISDWACEQIRRSCWTSTSGAHCGCCTVCGSGYMYIPLLFSFLFSRAFQTYYHPLGLDFQ